jgi:hypothetical protein
VPESTATWLLKFDGFGTLKRVANFSRALIRGINSVRFPCHQIDVRLRPRSPIVGRRSLEESRDD